MFWLYDVTVTVICKTICNVLLQKFTKRPRLDLLLLQVSQWYAYSQAAVKSTFIQSIGNKLNTTNIN